MPYQKNLEHHLKMLDKTWEAFEKHGVTKDTKLVLEFVYAAPDKDSAVSLDTALDNYESTLKSKGLLKKKWFVYGKSHPRSISKDSLTQWIETMVALGWEHGCEFDGFGASVTVNRKESN